MAHLRDISPSAHLLNDDGVYPNNARLPLLVYPALYDRAHTTASICEELIQKNGWGNSWRNGIYGFHHYHSTAHEALMVYSGSATVQMGGENGLVLEIQAGDGLVIPAGIAHKRLSSRDFRVIGAYPPAQRPDLQRGMTGERPATDQNITRVPTPLTDPFLGTHGPLVQIWG